MPTTTSLDIRPAIDPDSSVADEDAYEIVDGVPQDRPGPDPEGDAYAEAYEIVDGQIQEWPIMGAYPEEIASILLEYLAPFVRQRGLGRAIVETRFQFKPKQQRRPDLAFISFNRCPKDAGRPRARPGSSSLSLPSR